MNYEKPKVVGSDSAIAAVQSNEKEPTQVIDSKSEQTNGAYQADE